MYSFSSLLIYNNYNSIMKKSFAISVSALLLLGIVPLISSASADPGASITFVPSLFSTGGTTEIRVGVSPAETTAVIVTRIGVVYPDVDSDGDTIPGDLSISTNPDVCQAKTPDLGDSMYIANDGEIERLGLIFPIGQTGYGALLFGDGDPLETSVQNNDDGAPGPAGDGSSITFTDPVDGDASPEPTFRWDRTTDGSPDSTSGTGIGTAFVCAFNDQNGNGVFNLGVDTPGSITQSFIVSLPVGGELIPINTTALLIAGISSNALWMLPTLATVAGVSFVLLRFQVTKKNN
jgi:hypothetical protein